MKSRKINNLLNIKSRKNKIKNNSTRRENFSNNNNNNNNNKTLKNKQEKHFITFGGPTINFHNRVKELCNDAKELNFFDNIKGFTDIDLKNDKIFWNNHCEFIENNKRGYGYWLWKPYIIKKYIDKMKYNDILIYCDCGCSFNKKGINRFYEYIEMLNTNINNYGIISFVLPLAIHIEKSWTKKKILDILNVSEDDKNSKQNMGGVLIIKKNNHSIDIINKWYKLSCNYELINDNISNEIDLFKENRHDQSLFSILVKQNGSIKLENEGVDVWLGGNTPIWATRKRS